MPPTSYTLQLYSQLHGSQPNRQAALRLIQNNFASAFDPNYQSGENKPTLRALIQAHMPENGSQSDLTRDMAHACRGLLKEWQAEAGAQESAATSA